MMMQAALRPNRARRQVSKPLSVPAPVEGWDASSALAAMKPARAVTLDNWFPQPGWVEVRRGFQWHVTGVGGATSPVESLMTWNGPSSAKMFAAGSTGIWDVTSAGLAGAAVVGALASTRLQWTTMTTAAGSFLIWCNGVDPPQHYNGAIWATPAISGITASDAIHVNVHKKRLWFTLKNTTKAAYLPTDAVAGAATVFNVGANFSSGGFLMGMATWTIDGGNGPDDYAAFISSEGEIALYQGTDPAAAATWALVGVFNLSAPIGRRCFIKYGGDLVILTQEGPLQLGLSLKSQESNLETKSLSSRIYRATNEASRLYSNNFGWEMVSYPKGTRFFVNVPLVDGGGAEQHVMNSLTGAWCRFTQHNAGCWAVFNDDLYFGGADGTVHRADIGSTDDGAPINADGETAYHGTVGGSGAIAHYKMIKPLLTTSGSLRAAIGVSTDFQKTANLSSPIGSSAASALWDSAIWDTAIWPTEETAINDWTAAPAIGTFASIRFTSQTGSNPTSTLWGYASWGVAVWGTQQSRDETMRVNGFLLAYEHGGML